MIAYGSIAAGAIADNPATGPVTHDTSGTLTGQIGAVVGSAAHVAVHPSSGALVGQIGSVSGSAARFRAFASSGDLVGQIGAVAGSATRFRSFDTSGALVGQIGAVSGSSARFRAMASTGVLVAQGAILAGSADRQSGSSPVTHDTTGELVGDGSVLSGLASRPSATNSGGFYDYGENIAIRRKYDKKLKQDTEKVIAQMQMVEAYKQAETERKAQDVAKRLQAEIAALEAQAVEYQNELAKQAAKQAEAEQLKQLQSLLIEAQLHLELMQQQAEELDVVFVAMMLAHA